MRAIGLSEVGAETIRRAHAVHPISDLQIEYSLISRGPETAIFPLLAELGIGVTAYGVLSRGLLSGSQPTAPGDYRAYLPRFTATTARQNQRARRRAAPARRRDGRRPAQLAIAWVRAKAHIVPDVGARTRKQLDEALGALARGADARRGRTHRGGGRRSGRRHALRRAQMKALDSER